MTAAAGRAGGPATPHLTSRRLWVTSPPFRGGFASQILFANSTDCVAAGVFYGRSRRAAAHVLAPFSRGAAGERRRAQPPSTLRRARLAIASSASCLASHRLQPMDRDEPRFAQASKQMLESGDFVDIRFQDEARHKKPVGIYWLQSAVVAVAEALGVPEARTTIALYRIPSLFGALATVLLTYWAALAFIGRRGAFLAAALMASSHPPHGRSAARQDRRGACRLRRGGHGGAGARLSRPGSAGCCRGERLAFFWLAARRRHPRSRARSSRCSSASAAVTLSWRERSARWLLALRPLDGAIVDAARRPALVRRHRDQERRRVLRGLGRPGHARQGRDGAGASIGGRPAIICSPSSRPSGPAAILAAHRGAVRLVSPRARTRSPSRSLGSSRAWLIFEAVPTKLPHYVLPLYPAIAILTVMAIGAAFVGPHRPGARGGHVLIPLHSRWR